MEQIIDSLQDPDQSQLLIESQIEEIEKKDKAKKKKGQMTTDENDEEIKITYQVYKDYFGKYYGISFFIVALLTMCTVMGGRIGSDYVVG